MHEMAIVSQVVDEVVKAADKEGATRVKSVTLTVGELHDVVDNLMDKCFAFLAKDTIAEGATLTLKKVPMRAQCTECKLVYPADLKRRETLVCPDCGSTDFSIFNGNEFIIHDIVVE